MKNICIQDMKEKDMKPKRLSHRELLEIVVVQSEEIDRLSSELADMAMRVNERQISLRNAGSIAEAALELNGVFEAAQRASEEYISEIRRLKDMQEEMYCNAEEEARQKADMVMKTTVQKCRKAQEETIRKCNAMIDHARSEAAKYTMLKNGGRNRMYAPEAGKHAGKNQER